MFHAWKLCDSVLNCSPQKYDHHPPKLRTLFTLFSQMCVTPKPGHYLPHAPLFDLQSQQQQVKAFSHCITSTSISVSPTGEELMIILGLYG